MAKIKIELGGEYTAGEMFTRAQNDVKKFGQQTKDAASIGVNSLKEIATQLGNDGVAGAAGVASKAIASIAQGGIFGVIATLAQEGIGLVCKYFKEAEEEAKKLAQLLRDEVSQGFTTLKEKVTGVKNDVAEAEKSIESLTKTAQGKIDGEVKMEVAKLHVETLQKITDGMSRAGQDLIKANEALQTETIKYTGEMNKINAERQGIIEREKALSSQEENAKAIVIEAEKKRADFINKYGNILDRHNELQRKANEKVEELTVLFGSQETAIKYHNSALKALSEFEEKNKDTLANEKAMTETLIKAKEEHAEITKKLNGKQSALDALSEKERLLQTEHQAKTIELTRAKEAATKATEQEANAARVAAEKRMLESAEAQRRLELESKLSELKNVTDKEMVILKQELNRCLEDGCEDAEIEHDINKKLKELREKRLKVEGELVDDMGKDGKGGRKSNNVVVQGASVRIDGDSIDRIINGGDFKQWQKQQKQDAREKRNLDNEMKKNIIPTQRWLKDNMPSKMKEQYEKWVKQHLTPNEWEKLTKQSQEKLMLSKKDQEQQKKAIEEMSKKIKEALTTR